MKELWDQSTMDFEVMHYFIVLAFISMIMTFIFSGVINAGSHFSSYELPFLQKYVIIFVLSNPFISLIFFISLASFTNASYLSLISMLLILMQWVIYFYYIQPIFLLFEFKKSYTKIDSLLNKSVNKKDQAFYEDYKNIDDNITMLEQHFMIKSYEIALAFASFNNKSENKTLIFNKAEYSYVDAAKKRYNMLSVGVIVFLIFNMILQMIEIILVNIDEYKKTSVLVYGLLRIVINLSFLVYFSIEIACFHKLLRKLNLPLKISCLILMIFLFNVQKPLIEIICICVEKEDAVNYAMIINFFMLSLENFIVSIIMLLSFSYKGLCFNEYKNILARFKMTTLDVRLTDNVPDASSYARHDDEKVGELMGNMELKEDLKNS